MPAAKFPLLPARQLGLLAVQSLLGAGIWDEPCQPAEFRHDQRVPFAHSGEGQHYRLAKPICSPLSSSTGIRPSRGSGQATETRRADSQAKVPSPYTADLRIPVAKASIAALADDPAPTGIDPPLPVLLAATISGQDSFDQHRHCCHLDHAGDSVLVKQVRAEEAMILFRHALFNSG